MDVPLKCRCGLLQGVATNIKSRNVRIACLCDDCQAYAHYLGSPELTLDKNGGTDICALTQAQIKFTKGVENLQCLRLSPRGLIRWYAGCCRTPIANSVPKAHFPFAGTVHAIMDFPNEKARDKTLGSVYARMMGRFAIGTPPEGTVEKISLKVMIGVLRFLVPALLTRAYRPSPFFDEQGKVRVEPKILSKQEREDLRRLCGPKQ